MAVSCIVHFPFLPSYVACHIFNFSSYYTTVLIAPCVLCRVTYVVCRLLTVMSCHFACRTSYIVWRVTCMYHFWGGGGRGRNVVYPGINCHMSCIACRASLVVLFFHISRMSYIVWYKTRTCIHISLYLASRSSFVRRSSVFHRSSLVARCSSFTVCDAAVVIIHCGWSFLVYHISCFARHSSLKCT